MHICTYTCVHKVHVRMQKTTPDTSWCRPKQGHGRRHAHMYTSAHRHDTHTHTTRHATYTTGTPARRALDRYWIEFAACAQTHARTRCIHKTHTREHTHSHDWSGMGASWSGHTPTIHTHPCLWPARMHIGGCEKARQCTANTLMYTCAAAHGM